MDSLPNYDVLIQMEKNFLDHDNKIRKNIEKLFNN